MRPGLGALSLARLLVRRPDELPNVASIARLSSFVIPDDNGDRTLLQVLLRGGPGVLLGRMTREALALAQPVRH